MSKGNKTQQDNTAKQSNTKSVERKERKADCLMGLKAQIDTFPIRIRDYAKVYASYFSTCPYCQGLKFNWPEISQELLDGDLDCPQWHCQKYAICPENHKCLPPLLSDDTLNEYYWLEDRDFYSFVEEKQRNLATGQMESQFERKFNFTEVLINFDKKVLVSPERLRECRTACQFTLQEIASRCWASNRQNWSIYETIPDKHDKLIKQQRLTSIGIKHKMRPMRYSECCYLAAIYKTTPGYLMGQIDNPKHDIAVHKYSYYKKKDGLLFTDLRNLEPDLEGFRVFPELFSPISFYSDKKRKGEEAYERVKEKLGNKETESEEDKKLFSIMNECIGLYYSSIRKDIIADVRLFFDGFLDDTIRY